MRRISEMLGDLVALEREARKTGVPSEELLGRRIERREFLRDAALAGAGLAAGPALLAACTTTKGPATSKPSEGEPRIAVVGAGLAGMTAAYRLWQAGFKPSVYEARDRVGGRTRTIRDVFDNGQTAEACGEYINSDHQALRSLASELALDEDNLWSYYDWSFSGLLWVDGAPYPHQDMIADFREVYPALHRDTLAAKWPITFDAHTEEAVPLDNMTLAEWIEKNVPGGRKSRFGRLVEVGYTGEYGLDAEGQSALNLMTEAGYSSKAKPKLYGNQDWRWRIRGGNDMITGAIADLLPPGSVILESALKAIRADAGGTYTLTFDSGGKTEDATFDRVVLTLPFTTLRLVDYSKAGFDDLKIRAIEKKGMGTNSKLHMQFKKRVWEEAGLSGDTVTDLPFQETTIVYPTPDYPGGILDVYTGGKAGASYGASVAEGPASRETVERTLTQMEAIMPGIKSAWNGKSQLHYCVADNWQLGSYACPIPGEYTTIYGSELLPQEGIHFAGEHTSINYLGFMNGAVESGERVVPEVIGALAGPRSTPGP